MANKLQSLSEDVYSTHPEFEYEYANVSEPDTLPPSGQNLKIAVTKRKMDGMVITSITGFVGKRMDLIKVEQSLQQVCRTCGMSKMYDIILFRDVRKRAFVYLRNQGYNVRFSDS
jgi:translation initiation factor 1 (eIF-1/SUI1)